MLPKEVLKKMEKEFGMEIKYPQQTEALAEAIFEKTGERLGTSTLKRIFGIVEQKICPRTTTLDIIGKYLDYDNYQSLCADLNLEGDSHISAFTPIESLEVEELEEGSQIQVTYNPGRVIIMSYLGDFKFIVNTSEKSKLIKGDVVKISQLAIGYDLRVSEVIRNGENLGGYVGAKQNGLTSIEILG